MNWISYALIAIGLVGVSDIFRKLASQLKDPFFANLLFQLGASSAAIILFFLLRRKVEYNPQLMVFAVIGGVLVSTFTLFSFKALATGPGVSAVMPVLRTGGVTLVAILGIIFLREKITAQTITGLLFAVVGIYLLFSAK